MILFKIANKLRFFLISYIMNRSIYRNCYYVKESILEFFQCNKKHFILSIISIIVGVALGLFVAINNTTNFTIINILQIHILS